MPSFLQSLWKNYLQAEDNKSSDDATGMAVSERVRAKLRSLDVAKRNANDGVSYIKLPKADLMKFLYC